MHNKSSAGFVLFCFVFFAGFCNFAGFCFFNYGFFDIM